MRRVPLAVAGLTVLLASPTVARADEIVVGFDRAIGPVLERRLAAEAGTRLVRRIAPLRAVRLRVPRDRRAAALARLGADPNVAFATVDPQIRVNPRPRLGPPIAGIARTPDDKGFSYQYALLQDHDHDIDATNAWKDHTHCSKVAVLDSGIDIDHPDLKPNLWRNPGEVPSNGIDDDHNGYVDDVVGVDLVRGHGSGVDHAGHGSHVAGIIGARGDNERGVSGVCWQADIVSIRFLDADGQGSSATSAEGIVYAVDVGARIVNASYGTDQPSDIEQRAVDYARDHGVLIVAAAGNDGRDTDAKANYPASYPGDNIISVAATDEHDHLADFSNYGAASVDLAAPGTDIASTWMDDDYREASGTSMAAPFVTAAAAMLREADHPSAAALRDALLRSVDRVSGLAGKTGSGGRLNLDRALRDAAGCAQGRAAPAGSSSHPRVDREEVVLARAQVTRPVAERPGQPPLAGRPVVLGIVEDVVADRLGGARGLLDLRRADQALLVHRVGPQPCRAVGAELIVDGPSLRAAGPQVVLGADAVRGLVRHDIGHREVPAGPARPARAARQERRAAPELAGEREPDVDGAVGRAIERVHGLGHHRTGGAG